MAGKPRDQWSDAYRRRIERAEARGKSHQEARGHRPGEARRRAERERREEGLRGGERAAVRRWATRRYAGDVVVIDPDDAVEWAASVGYDTFKEMREQLRELNRQYRRELVNGTYVKGGHAQYWQGLNSMFEPPDISWLYYH